MTLRPWTPADEGFEPVALPQRDPEEIEADRMRAIAEDCGMAWIGDVAEDVLFDLWREGERAA